MGGLDKGLARATGLEVAFQVEIDPFCRRVLAARFPGVPQHDDIRTFRVAAFPRASVICGGFPCTDLSVAGKQAGLSGARSGLWYEFYRVVKEALSLSKPILVIENVAHGWKQWVPFVRSDLGQIGYASVPLQLSAAEVGAPHERRRIFIVSAPADSHGERLRHLAERFTSRRSNAVRGQREDEPRHYGSPRVTPRSSAWPDRPELFRVDDELPHRLDRRRALGNAVVPRCAEVIGSAIVSAGLLHDPTF